MVKVLKYSYVIALILTFVIVTVLLMSPGIEIAFEDKKTVISGMKLVFGGQRLKIEGDITGVLGDKMDFAWSASAAFFQSCVIIVILLLQSLFTTTRTTFLERVHEFFDDHPILINAVLAILLLSNIYYIFNIPNAFIDANRSSHRFTATLQAGPIIAGILAIIAALLVVARIIASYKVDFDD